MTATKTAPRLCVRCKARRAAAYVHTDVVITRTSEDAPDVLADREHRMTISTWTACAACSGGTR